ncbi:MAG: DUF4125 family protein [Eubacterium sp.]|nr:DUF4125 family protein [Eubacterium sp.]
MEIKKFLDELDVLFEEKKLNEVEPFLNKSLDEAIKLDDYSAQFTILNEMMGFFRDTSQYDKSIKACENCIVVMKKMGIEGTVDYATSLQNIANAYRAAGLLEQSLKCYKETFHIYENNIPAGDYRFASLNNNIALLYQEMGNFQMAVNHLRAALSIIEKIHGEEIAVAITQSNLGASLLELGEVNEAIKYLEKSLDTYRKDEVKDFHYSAALSAMAAAKCRQGLYHQAVELYEEALSEIETNMGKGTAYEITKQNLEKAKEECTDNITGIELAQRFYEEIGAPMLHEKFPEFEDKIAVGFVGEGSERFGFDDEFSKDHDFGPGFCMWVTESTYDVIGERLQEEYNKLPKSYLGITRTDTIMAQGRCGVQIIGDFYERYTGFRQSPEKVSDWIDIDDYKLATVTNGEVFRDDEGIFINIRNNFMKQPEQARLVKLARELSGMAQMGQVNYGRSMGRKDYVTANICIAKFMEHTMKCIYILNQKYAPYYKWLIKGIKTLEILPQMGDIMCALADMPDQRGTWENYQYNNTSVNEKDQKALTVEIVATLIIYELKKQELVNDISSNFLNDYVGVIMEKAEFNREDIIDEIVKLEYEAFDKVKNEGGRAECQNNWPFFYVMRKSQYLTWTNEMLVCIRELWLENKTKGWNMIMEKYGRMMENTAPEEYKGIEKKLPLKSAQTKAIVNQITEIQVEWMKDFAKVYPKLAGQARSITSDTDAIDNASYETYLKGELLTYSDELLKMYAQFIVDLYREGKNLAKMTIENTARLQGYCSLDEAENGLGR